MDNYTILHLHSMDSNPYSGLQVDSITPYHQYIDKAKELNMKAIAFTEHGSVLHNIEKHQRCQKAGIKLIHAEEFYITEKINSDKQKRDNYHCCLYARNYDGVRELNKLSSISMNRNDGHFYFNPRITFDELINTSDNILISTACVAGILSKAEMELKKRFLNFLSKNKNRCWLEIMPHEFDYQIEYNRLLYKISQKTGLPLLVTSDIHAVDKKQLEARKIMQKSKNVNFSDEDECDLAFKTYNELIEAFEKQGCFLKDIYMNAIEETNHLADLVEDYELDYSFKYPRFENAEKKFQIAIKQGIKDRGINKLPNFETDYKPRIKEEYMVYKNNDAIDFMLLDADYKRWMRNNGMHYGLSRGSVSGSLIAYLLHITDVDSVKFNLNFSRFMNSERVSLADIDTDIYAEDRYKVREYLFGKQNEHFHCCNIVTFNTIQLRGAIKDIGRAYGLLPEETQSICNSIIEDDNGNEIVPESIIKQYKEMFEYVYLVIGVITSLGRHAAGIVISPTDITYDFGTLSLESDPRPVSQIDMHEIDSLNYVKLDLLGLNAVGLISQACEFAGIDYLTPDNTDLNDENVIKSIAEDTTLIFQFESDFAGDSLKKVLSAETLKCIKDKNPNTSYIDIISMTSGAIRPAGESYRDQLFQGIYNDNGNEVLNEFLAPTLNYLVYQEQIIEFLHRFCGFTMGQADIVRRGFAKKTGTEKYIPVIKDGGYLVDIKGNKDDRYIKGFIATVQEEYGMTKEEAEKTIVNFLKVIEDASSYLFSKNHSDPYSMIGYFIGWLRYYYPIELFTAALNVYESNKNKCTAIKEYIYSKGYEIRPIKYGKSKAKYFFDKKENTIYQGISSIAYMNTQVADELYELSKNPSNNFIDLLNKIKNTSLDDRQTKILISLNFFSDFGQNQYLLNVYELYKTIYSRKEFKKIELEKYNIPETLMRKFSHKETEKLFKDIDMDGLFEKLIENVPQKSLTIQEQIKADIDYLGYTDYVNPKIDKNIYIVTDYKTYDDETKPYFSMRRCSDGEVIRTRIKYSKIYRRNPFGLFSILQTDGFDYCYKKKNVGNNEWEDTDELVPILNNYEVLVK